MSGILTIAPETCVEVRSPADTRAEIKEMRRLYFEAGAKEVWIASTGREIACFDETGEREGSTICPAFPAKVPL